MSMNQIEHLVVVMLENRSLDNLLGWLYDTELGQVPANVLPPGSPPAFDGLLRGMSIPAKVGDPNSKLVLVGYGAPNTITPTTDPQEHFDHMTAQIFGPQAPSWHPTWPMKGFVQDYATTSTDDASQIMACYTPEQLPILSALARNYAVSDAWFASAPCQTWPNRSFVHAGTSNGHVNNGLIPDPLHWDVPTIFGALDPGDWCVYSDALVAPSLTRTMFPSLWTGDYDANFSRFSDFEAACANATLPKYSFLEPSFLVDPNDQHPPHDVDAGEAFLYRIWQAVTNPAVWSKTMLVITYDEHGGTFDHVFPATPATAPDAVSAKAPEGFAFDRFGVRVPCVVVSPWIDAGTVFRSPTDTPYDHTSILATLRDWLGIPETKMISSARVVKAPTLAQLVTRAAARTDIPDIPAPADSHLQPSLGEPLNDLQMSLVSGAARRFQGNPAQTLAATPTRRHAAEYFAQKLPRMGG